MFPIPDLLNLRPRLAVDGEAVDELLELAFLGKEDPERIERELGAVREERTGWQLDFFAEDLFVEELIRSCFTVELDGVRFPVNRTFLYGVLSNPPTELEAVHFRQEILRELESDAEVRASTEKLYRELTRLLAMFKQPDYAASLDVHAFRLDLFRQARGVIDWMVEGFAGAGSGLRRLHETGLEIRDSEEYRILADLLDYESRRAELRLDVHLGADGELKLVRIAERRENRANRFYRGHWRNLFDRFVALFLYGHRLNRKQLFGRLLSEVYQRISPSFTPLTQLIGQLEVYLAALGFRRRAEERGLPMALARITVDRPLAVEGLFNPLLLEREQPVPCSIRCRDARAITIVTGPNSGGKTRLLQALGLAQVLGQSGLYVPAAAAELPLLRGLFVSLVETETASQAEGRLGRELVRIRGLFETIGAPAMVILDELCSGTNPAEGVEIFELVVRLLDRLDTVTFISTHYLDFSRELRDRAPVPSLEFLQVETDGLLASTYQFEPGIAETSLAAATARRLGVTFEELSALIDRRRGESEGNEESEAQVPAAAAD